MDPKDDRLLSDRTSTTMDLEFSDNIYMHINSMAVNIVNVKIGHTVLSIKPL